MGINYETAMKPYTMEAIDWLNNSFDSTSEPHVSVEEATAEFVQSILESVEDCSELARGLYLLLDALSCFKRAANLVEVEE